MIDFAAARETMVDTQLRPSDVTDLRILNAFLQVPREKFVASERAALAYADRDIPATKLVNGQAVRRLMPPMVLAKLLQAAGIGPDDRLLVIGCATGYSAAIVSHLASAVVALEEDAVLAKAANRTLAEVGAANVTLVTGPLTAGWPALGPYDVILVDGAVEILPQPILAQIKDGGRLAAVTVDGPVGKGMIYRATGSNVTGQPVFDAPAPLLPGFARPPEFVF